MDTLSLQIFIETAERLHFGRASRACNRSPSALTRTIQRLEEEAGCPLFRRDNRSVELTDAGRTFLVYARQAVQARQDLQAALAADGDRIAGTLSIYASVTAVYSLLPALLEACRGSLPDVQLELRTGDAEQAIGQVLSGEIDLAVAALPDRKPPGLEFMPLTETPLVFIAPRPMGRIDFSREPLIVPQSGVARRRLDGWLKKRGLTPRIAAEVSGNEALIALVRLGAGIGIVPALVLERSPLRDAVHVPAQAPKLASFVVGLCAEQRNLRRPAVQAFWRLSERL